MMQSSRSVSRSSNRKKLLTGPKDLNLHPHLTEFWQALSNGPSQTLRRNGAMTRNAFSSRISLMALLSIMTRLRLLEAADAKSLGVTIGVYPSSSRPCTGSKEMYMSKLPKCRHLIHIHSDWIMPASCSHFPSIFYADHSKVDFTHLGFAVDGSPS